MDWKGIVIHHSLSHDVSAKEIDRWHRQRGWKGIGYHFVVRRSGAIELGRNIGLQGAHSPDRNRTHIGICVAGNFSEDAPHKRQLQALVYLCRGLINTYEIQDLPQRHNENCPGKYLNMDLIRRAISSLV